MSARNPITAYRLGLRMALLPLQVACKDITVRQARVLLSLPWSQGIKALARQTDCGKDTVVNALRSFRASGLVVHSRPRRRTHPSIYQLTPAGEAIFTPPQRRAN